ncbi:MAG: DUF2007 domain-containing protein [Actinomycetota bacterium]
MTSRAPAPFVRLATLPDPAAADLCAALLRSAGIESRLRGESLGPYRLTIGEMAATEVWVPAAQLDDARSLLEEATVPGEVDTAPRGGAEPAGAAGSGAGMRTWWAAVALGMLAVLVWRLLSRLA